MNEGEGGAAEAACWALPEKPKPGSVQDPAIWSSNPWCMILTHLQQSHTLTSPRYGGHSLLQSAHFLKTINPQLDCKWKFKFIHTLVTE